MHNFNSEAEEEIYVPFMEEVTTYLSGDVSSIEYFYSNIPGIEAFCTFEEFETLLYREDVGDFDDTTLYRRADRLFSILVQKARAEEAYYM